MIFFLGVKTLTTHRFDRTEMCGRITSAVHIIAILNLVRTGLFILGLLISICWATPTLATSPSITTQTVEETVREYFVDLPVMIEIARCESKFRQFADSGSALRGGMGGQMVGVFQFFDRYHTSSAHELGFDIETLEGNLGYARYTYERKGTSPWNSARACWDITDLNAIEATVVSDADLRQQIGLLRQIIELLQTFIRLKQNNV